jgi:hypothetical protein
VKAVSSEHSDCCAAEEAQWLYISRFHPNNHWFYRMFIEHKSQHIEDGHPEICKNGVHFAGWHWWLAWQPQVTCLMGCVAHH